MMRSARASSSAAKAVARSLVRAAAIKAMARYGAGAVPAVLALAIVVAAFIAASQAASSTVWSVRCTVVAPLMTLAAQRIDSARKSAGSNIASPIPSWSAWGPLSIRFWERALSMMTVTAFAGPMSRGSR